VTEKEAHGEDIEGKDVDEGDEEAAGIDRQFLQVRGITNMIGRTLGGR
jgi:hypothetical protein